MSVLASCSKDLKFYSWPSLNLTNTYETRLENSAFRTISYSNDGKSLLALQLKENPVVLTTPFHEESAIILKNSSAKSGSFSNTSATTVAFGDDDGSIYIYDIKKRRKLNDYQPVGSSVNFVEFSHEDTCLAIGCANGQIVLYASNPQPCASYLVSYSHSLSTMAFDKTRSDLLAAASREGIMNVWNTAKGVAIVNGKEHTGIVTGLTFCDNGLISVGNDGKMVCYDLRSGDYVSCHNLNAALSSVAVPQLNANEIAVGTFDGQIRSYDKRSMSSPIMSVAAYETLVRKLCFAPPTAGKANLSRPTTKGSNSLEMKNQSRLKSSYLEQCSAGDFNNSDSMSDCGATVAAESLYKLPLVSASVSQNELDNVLNTLTATGMGTRQVNYDELQRFVEEVEERFENYKKKMEEKMLSEFYRIRIEASKQFIELQDKIEKSWDGFMNYLKMTSANGQCDEYEEIRTVCGGSTTNNTTRNSRRKQ